MDGNNSLKRLINMGDRNVADRRNFEDNDYYLPKPYVEKFANEVKARRSPTEKHDVSMDVDVVSPAGDDSTANGGALVQEVPHAEGTTDSEDLDATPDHDISRNPEPAPADTDDPIPDGIHLSLDEGDPVDSIIRDNLVKNCVNNWKSAKSEESKKMWAIFDECGVFASACRHGFILWLIDMIRSGELYVWLLVPMCVTDDVSYCSAKYPLAIVARVLETIGEGTCGAYDIGCGFLGTILSSSLGPEFERLKSLMCVNAFHGYSHNYACQTVHHPNVVDGVGIEDFETLERIFSASNEVAPLVRYASTFRRRLFIVMHFRQWDEDKYANLSGMLFSNYVQAVSIIEGEEELTRSKRALEIADGQLEQWEGEEKKYIEELGREAPADVHGVAYVELLQDLWQIR